jgi:hypothetical protein
MKVLPCIMWIYAEPPSGFGHELPQANCAYMRARGLSEIAFNGDIGSK